MSRFLNSERLGSVVAKEEYENPYEYSEEGENVDPPRFHSYINFFPLKEEEGGNVMDRSSKGGGRRVLVK